MRDDGTSQAALTASLLEGLARFRAAGASGNVLHGQNLFSYCAVTRERLRAVNLSHPILGVVISGAKEVWRGSEACKLPSGAMFALPENSKMDVLNLPDERSGSYQSIVLEVPDAAELLKSPHMPPVRRQGAAAALSVRIRLTSHLVDAMIHAASAISEGPLRPSIRHARLTELLTLLQVDPAAAVLFDRSVPARVLALVRGDLSRDWKAPAVARIIGLSESTLRRRLAGEGTSFAKLLSSERMLVAKSMMERGQRAQDVALAVGYSSRSHFARQFRAAFGKNPSALKICEAENRCA